MLSGLGAAGAGAVAGACANAGVNTTANIAKNRDASVDSSFGTDMKNGCLYNVVVTLLTTHAVPVMNDFHTVQACNLVRLGTG